MISYLYLCCFYIIYNFASDFTIQFLLIFETPLICDENVFAVVLH